MVIGNRRFTRLSPTLVRIEFAPDGQFEDRRSMVAYAEQVPQPFESVTSEGDWTVLDTGKTQIWTRQDDRSPDRTTLEVRWTDGQLVQIWRPHDRDYQNLGGILRSLDRYGGEACELDGVHPATMESPDIHATNWPAWLQCEVDPPYDELHPDPPEGYRRGHWLRKAQSNANDGSVSHRTFNWYKDARKFAPGLLSRAGYFFLNDSESAVLDEDDFPVERDRPGCTDWYFFAYADDYKQALRDFRLLSGPAAIPTHRSFGIIFSRWPAFTESEVEDMARDFAANGYPLATLVMDMEWHKEGWGHWEFNPELIPDPERFFALCQKHGLEVTFNDHPLDVREDDRHYDAYVEAAGPDVEIRERNYNDKRLKMARVDICDKQQSRAFLETCHNHILDLGLDYWWDDGSRGQMAGTCGQLVCNKTLFEESEREGRRGMLLSRHGGLGSHRYGAFFTGDANSDWHVLRLQVEFNVRAAGVGVGHVSHDIGGFMIGGKQLVQNQAGKDIVDPVRYLRWLQFGVFGPILRFHSSPGSGSRLPYDYDSEVGGACRRWLRVRHSLLPYIYTAARSYYETGIPITRGLFLDEPDNPEAYRWDEYNFGPDMFVAPVLDESGEREFYLPRGQWYEFESAAMLDGGKSVARPVGLDDVPVYVRAGSVLPRRDPDDDVHAPHVDNLWLDIYPAAEGTAELYEDDGRSTEYQRGQFCRTRFELERASGERLVLRGTVAEGSPLGRTRAIRLFISLPEAESPVAHVNGQTLPMLAEETKGRFRVDLPALNADDTVEVEIES